jgi:hypothetical protein
VRPCAFVPHGSDRGHEHKHAAGRTARTARTWTGALN